MDQEDLDGLGATHRRFAVDAFNTVWDLLEKAEHTPDDDRRMLEATFASRYHWQEIGSAENHMVGDWQIARVLAELGYGSLALLYAETCLAACEEHGFGPYLKATAHEVMARSYAALGDRDRRQEHLFAGREVAGEIPQDEDREYMLSQLDAIPAVAGTSTSVHG